MERDSDGKYHYVYRTTCLVNGKYYLGKHTTRRLEDGYLGSGTYFRNALKLYGKENFTREILQFVESKDAAKNLEKEIITDEMRSDAMCMNIAPGGGGGFIDADHQRKCALAGASAGGLGTKSRMKTDHQFDMKLRKTRSEQRSNFLKENPEIAARHQTSMVEAARFSDKRKITFKERCHSQGEKNSQFGSCWVTNGVKPIKIKKEHLDEFLLNGYSRGRRIPTCSR